ncbi:hypothetical protein ABMA32_18910 [Mesorhizobium sp. VNQ89]|uniref:hypothetical protein n=1 Tax=Mesorhizobium quangtriensis TaxID=3157709 RepID=UPI0032B7F3C5
MKRKVLATVFSLAAAATAFAGIDAAFAGGRDKQFFQSIEGTWTGAGEIVAGKYKGTKFNCTFDGSTPGKNLGMTLDGNCRVGVFTQKMTATVAANTAVGYKGQFQDGAAGTGLDITAGNVVNDRKVVFAIHRNDLRGVMQARLPNDDTMNVTISVRVEESMVPVIGMSLKRVDATAVGAIAQQ